MTSIINVRGRRRDREAAARANEIAVLKNELRRQYLAAEELTHAAEADLASALSTNAIQLRRTLDERLPAVHADWSIDLWSSWHADATEEHTQIRLGSMREARSGHLLGLPVTFPLRADAGPLVLVSRTAAERDVALELLGSLVVRVSASCPKQIRIALLDPQRSGATFPMSRRLERVLLGFDEVQRPLDELRSDMARIESAYLDRHHPTFDDLPPTMRLGESRQVVFAASAPVGYDARSLEALLAVAIDGPRCGVHAIVHLDLDLAPTATDLLARLAAGGATVVEMGGTQVEHESVLGDVVFDELPSGALQELVFQRIATTPRRDRPVPWDDIQDLGADEWWEEVSDELVATPVGRSGAGDAYDLWFGTDSSAGRSCTHGLVVGGAPTGRQFVFDSLLAGLAARYAPNELRVFLVESRDHSTFAPWSRLAHAEVVALSPSPAQARNALSELRKIAERQLTEMDRTGCATLAEWRSDPARPMLPRWLAIFDGYEQIFENDIDDTAIRDLARVLEIGERAGVHVLLGGSRFDRAAPLHRAGLFDRFDLRLALQLFADDTLGRDEFGIRGVRMVQRVCDRPFRAVVNTLRGHDDGNRPMQLATLEPRRREELIAAVAGQARAEQLNAAGALVLNGSEQPQLAENPMLARLVGEPQRRTPAALADFARRSPANGGLGIDDWIAEDHPLLMFVGQEETLHGQAHFVIRRRPTENVVVVMNDRDTRMGTLASLLLSSVLSEQNGVEFWISDRGPTDTPAGAAIEQAVRRLARLDLPCRYTRSGDESAEFIQAVAAEVARRRTVSEDEVAQTPSSFLVLVEPERISALGRTPTELGTTDSELGLQLRYVLMQGPAVGVHTMLVSSSLPALTTVVAETVIHQELRHRLVTRLAEEDSFALVRSSRAAGLAAGDGQATTAVLFDSHTQAATTFKPYSTAGTESNRAGPLVAQLGSIFDTLGEQVGV